ncbi:uncharacterized protein N7473_004473 [Penicillium subrubescens]|uniref:uncharacterized protein n=1 Tax=Penicillium subrubescens TaxID=1316194 RepID=UPI002544EF23|nr:uncharacterized protein N7473_004473 [Penicillium subrubescens]KAJ5900403.1 hypothetical protein N7473_004473 [Penicillium subrubescens]
MLADRCTSATFANGSRRIRGFRKIPIKNNNTFPNEEADDPTEVNGPYRLVRQVAHTRLQPLALQGVPVERFNSIVIDTRAMTPPKITVSLSSSVSLGAEHTSSELFGKVGDTLSPGPVAVGSKTGIYGLTTFIPIISGGPITSPSATSNPTLEIIAHQQINSWVEHPGAPEATGVIHAIENIHPHIEGLLSKLEPEPGSKSCKSTSRKRIKRDLSSRSAFLSLFDLVDNTLCSVNDIKNNVRDNILNDVKSNLKDLQNAVDNLSQEAGPYKTPLSLQANRLRTHQLHRYLALRQQQSAIVVSFATYQPYPLLPSTGTTTTTTVEACTKPSGWNTVADGEDFPMSQHLSISGIAAPSGATLPTHSYNPGRTPPSATPARSYAPGKCKVHIVQALGQQFRDPEVVLGINITDAHGTTIGNNKGSVKWGQTLNTDSLLPWVLIVTPQSGISSKRGTSGAFLRKRVGGPIHSNRLLFVSGPVDFAEKREMVEHHDKGWKQGLKSPSPTIGNDPSPSVEQLYKIRDLNPQASHGAAWVKYAPSGARYFKEWQEKTGDDIGYPCDFDDFFNVVALNRAQPASGIRGNPQEAGYGTGREYLAVSIEGPKDNLIADFTNTISATQGVFLANANDRGSPRVAWQFSAVAWELWKRTVLTENPEWKNDMSKADYSGVMSFWRREIDNEDTSPSSTKLSMTWISIPSRRGTRPILMKIPTLSGRCWGAPMAMESSTS